MIYTTDSTSSGDTERLGELLGSLISPPLVLELVGDLGAGKTSLVRGLARGFGSRSIATSPSFSLSNIYETDNGKIYHFDLYRLGDDPGILQNELAEVLDEPRAVVVVEWGKSVGKLLPDNRITITLSADAENEDKRQVKFKYRPEHRGIMTKLETFWAEGRP